uniref:Uncharacterized protein n=1 Tax=Avena sativa TaxID=4498 RepID=A0ACD5WF56_AVESA
MRFKSRCSLYALNGQLMENVGGLGVTSAYRIPYKGCFAEASRRRWKAAYAELPSGHNPKLAELQQSDLEDSKTCDALFHVDNSQLQIVQLKEATNGAEPSHSNADHEDIARDLRAELRKFKQACETLTSNKDKEVSALRAVKDFLWNQLRAMDKDNAALLKIKEIESAQMTEAAEKLQQKTEELEVAARNKDGEIRRLRAENKETSNKRARLCSKMCIFVKIHDGKTISLEVADSDTINSVKAKIQDKEGIPAGNLRLMYVNRLLVGSRTLKDQNIQEEDILDVVFRGMHVIAKMRSGKSTTLEVESSDTIHSVKAKIFDQTCMAPAGQRLFFADKLLVDGCTLADYNIKNDSVLAAEFHFPLERLRVSVVTQTGKSIIEHAFMRSDTVDDVKARIYAELGIHPDEHYLLFCGDLLEDGQPLFPEIFGAGRLHLHLRPPGGQ